MFPTAPRSVQLPLCIVNFFVNVKRAIELETGVLVTKGRMENKTKHCTVVPCGTLLHGSPQPSLTELNLNLKAAAHPSALPTGAGHIL